MNFKQQPIWTHRSAGTIMPILSLDSAYGCGDFEAACKMLDYLYTCGITTVFILPVGPLGHGNSPYSPQSSVGGCHYFISPDWLCRDGLVTKDQCAELARAERTSRESIDYGVLYRTRLPFLRLAFNTFELDATKAMALDAFIRERNDLAETVLFLSIKDAQGGLPWWEWDDAELAAHEEGAVARFKQQRASLVRFYWFVQYLFHNQLSELRTFAQGKQMQLVGDMPFYVAPDSADVWAHRRLFAVDPNTGEVLLSGGAPPCSMTDDLQIWGNPVYNWETCPSEVLQLWKARLAWYAPYFSGLRIDYAVGLKRCYCVSMDGTRAQWQATPFDELCSLINDFSQSNHLQIICEDLGAVLPRLRERIASLGWFPMKVIQHLNLAHYDAADENNPANYTENMAVFTGTHDKVPLKVYLETISYEKLSILRTIAGSEQCGKSELREALIGKIYQSKAKVCVIQLQDLLETGIETALIRIQYLDAAWTWRVPGKLLTRERAEKFRRLAEASNRFHEYK